MLRRDMPLTAVALECEDDTGAINDRRWSELLTQEPLTWAVVLVFTKTNWGVDQRMPGSTRHFFVHTHTPLPTARERETKSDKGRTKTEKREQHGTNVAREVLKGGRDNGSATTSTSNSHTRKRIVVSSSVASDLDRPQRRDNKCTAISRHHRPQRTNGEQQRWQAKRVPHSAISTNGVPTPNHRKDANSEKPNEGNEGNEANEGNEGNEGSE